MLTEDTDFGELIFLLQLPSVGVVLLRFGAAPFEVKARTLLSAFDSGIQIRQRFTVVQTDRVRSRPLPGAGWPPRCRRLVAARPHEEVP